jgi:hypothetical protein
VSAGRRSPILWVIAAPASVAVWSGWVGLGQKAGWNEVKPFPGIADGFTFPSALLLPIGVEAYGLYAMSKWLSPSTPARARNFAGWSALGSLLIGALGQVCYHLLAAQGRTVAPDWVVVAVASLPVAVLGMAGLLSHLCDVDPGPVEIEHPDQSPGPVTVRESSRPATGPVRPDQTSGPNIRTTGPLPMVRPDQTSGPNPKRSTPKPRTTTRRTRTTDQQHLARIAGLVAEGVLPDQPSATRIQAALGINKTKARHLRDLYANQADTPATAVAG